MQLETFQLIDRIVDLNIGEKTITVEAQVPQQNTIFEEIGRASCRERV